MTLQGPASSVEEFLLSNILQFKGPLFKTFHTPGFFALWKIKNVGHQILEPQLVETKKAVVTRNSTE